MGADIEDLKIEYAISFFPSGTGWHVILGLFYMHLLFTGSVLVRASGSSTAGHESYSVRQARERRSVRSNVVTQIQMLRPAEPEVDCSCSKEYLLRREHVHRHPPRYQQQLPG
jgi:hypothetical protein